MVDEQVVESVPGNLLRFGHLTAMAVLAAALISACSSTRSAADSASWSALPHTMGCQVLPWGPAADKSMFQPLPAVAWVDWVSVRNPGDQRLEVTLDFPQGPPPDGYFYGAMIGRTTDIDRVTDNDPFFSVDSPDRSRPSTSSWRADVSGLDRPQQKTLLSVTRSGHTVDFVVDLDGQNKLLGSGPFKPEFQLSSGTSATGDSRVPPAQFQQEACTWKTPIASAPPVGGSAPAAAAPQQQPAPAPAPETGSVAVSDADGHGFIGNYLARCLDVDPAVAIGRTTNSLVVICQSRSGALYYRGMGLKNQLGVYIDGVTPTSMGFTVTNNGVKYTISSSELQISQGGTTLADEPMTEYWAR